MQPALAKSQYGISSVQVAATSATVPLMDVMGRTKLLIMSSNVCIVSMVAIGAIHVWGEGSGSLEPTVANRVAVLFVAVFIIGFSMGLGPVVWILAAELVPLRGLGTSLAVACAFNWACSFVVTIFFEFARETFKFSGMGLFYSGVTFVGCVLVKYYMPETAKKTLEEILLQQLCVGDDTSQSNASRRTPIPGRDEPFRQGLGSQKRSAPQSRH